MEKTKLQLIEFIINAAHDDTLEGLYNLLISEDFIAGIDTLNNSYGGQIKKELYKDIIDELDYLLQDVNSGEKQEILSQNVERLLNEYKRKTK